MTFKSNNIVRIGICCLLGISLAVSCSNTYSQGFGIGVSSPANTLDVEGNAVVGATYSGTNAAPANGMLIEGNVGIGNTSGSEPLHVTADAGHDNVRLEENSGGQYWNLSIDAAGDLNFEDNGTEEITFELGGDVGIGTASPSHQLHIVDDVAGTADHAGLYVDHSGAITGLAIGYAGYFKKTGASGQNWGIYTAASGATSVNYGLWATATSPVNVNATGVVGRAITSGTGNGYAGHFSSTGTGANSYDVYSTGASTATNAYGIYAEKTGGATTNYAGYFTSTGAVNNYSIVVPAAGGDAGIGTITPAHQLHIVDAVAVVGSNRSGIYVDHSGAVTGVAAGYAGYFTKTGASVANYGIYSEATTATANNYGLYSVATSAVNVHASGVWGDATSSGTGDTYGGRFDAHGTSDDSYGVLIGNNSTGTDAFGIKSVCNGAATNNYAGYFTSTGGTNDYAIVTPAGEGNIGFGTITPVASALLDMTSTTQGLLPPRMTTAQRDAIAAPATGLLLYVTDITTGYWYYDGTNWVPLYSPSEGLQAVRKAADESVVSSTVMQNDDDLAISVEANEVWHIEGQMEVTSASATPDFKMDFDIPSGSMRITVIWNQDGDGQGRREEEVLSADVTTHANPIDLNSSNYVRFRGIFVNGATAGNFQVRWAQNTSDATATTVKTNSYIKGIRMTE